MNRPRILVIHAWMKGNVGDVLQLSVLLSSLRELAPAALDLAGYPPQPAEETQEVLALVDQYLPDPFPWWWGFAPRALGRLFERRWRRSRAALFSRYDAIVCAPGPYLADYDPRAASALADITVAADLKLPVVLASHSIGPLGRAGIVAVGRATARIAREKATHAYLLAHHLPAVLSADYAFLYDYQRGAAPPVDGPYRVVFLRSNNLAAKRLRHVDGRLLDDARLVADGQGERLVLATSDVRRDGRFLAGLAQRLSLPFIACRSVPELVALVDGSSGVVSDRYHPAICAAVLGKSAEVISNREPHKMEGLRHLLAGSAVGELQELARTGLRAVRQALGGAQ